MTPAPASSGQAEFCWVEFGSDVTLVDSAGERRALVDAFEETRGVKVRCVHAASVTCVVSARELADRLAVPLLVSARAASEVAGDALRGSTVIAESEWLARNCIAAGVAAADVVTILPGIDRIEYSPQGEKSDAPAGTPSLLCVVDEPPDALLEACSRLPGVRLLYAGAGKRDYTRYPFAQHATKADSGLYRWADALVIPGNDDESVRALARAFACGTPCIAAQGTAAGELVIDKWNGLRYDPAKAGDFERALRELCQTGTRARLAAPARAASDVFDAAHVRGRFLALVRSLFEAPKVSVVLPTYKRARLIEKAVRNVLVQDYPNFELIVVNDGSPDETGAILTRLQTELNDPRLRVITRENGGLPVALNTGFEAAGGEYWTWTSDDNAFKPGALRAMARELQMNPAAGLVFADMDVVSDEGRRRFYEAGPIETLRDKCCIGACFMYRRSVAQSVGEYDPEFRLVEDYDYWLRMYRSTEMVHLPRNLYDYHDEPDSLSRTRFTDVLEKHIRLLKREFGEAPGWREHLYSQLSWFASWHKNRGATLLAVSLACRLIRMRPFRGAGWWALARALTPRRLLNLTRRIRRLDAG
jgi:glycosyltransferase involved in cell wall biosynthesis